MLRAYDPGGSSSRSTVPDAIRPWPSGASRVTSPTTDTPAPNGPVAVHHQGLRLLERRRTGGEPLVELADQGIGLVELDVRRVVGPHVHHEVAAELVDVGPDQQELAGVLHGHEAVAGDLDQLRALEDLDRGAHRGLDLDHLRARGVARVGGLLVADQGQAEDAVTTVQLGAHRLEVEPDVVGGGVLVPAQVGQVLEVLWQRLRGLAEHDAAVVDAGGEVPALLVAGGAAHGLDRERCPGLREPAGHTRVGDGAEVVGVGHEHALEAGVDQLVEQAAAAERGVEVTVTGRTPLERRVDRPAHRLEVVDPDLRLLVLQELQRQPSTARSW
jgi:hypothetical protein